MTTKPDVAEETVKRACLSVCRILAVTHLWHLWSWCHAQSCNVFALHNVFTSFISPNARGQHNKFVISNSAFKKHAKFGYKSHELNQKLKLWVLTILT